MVVTDAVHVMIGRIQYKEKNHVSEQKNCVGLKNSECGPIKKNGDASLSYMWTRVHLLKWNTSYMDTVACI